MSDTEPVRTTGRPMTCQLAAALDDVTGRRRRLLIQILSAEESPRLARIYRAIALELRLAELREEAILTELAGPPAGVSHPGVPDPPPLTGPPFFFDPDA